MTGPSDRGGGGSGASQEAEPSGGSDAPKPAIAIDLVEDGGDWSFVPDVEKVVMIAAATAAQFDEARLAGTAAAVALSSDATVKTLNAAYRNKDKPTNVLSFPAHAGARPEPGAPRLIGDVVLAAETVAAEAADLGIPPAHHLQHLVVHGLLHLAGFDHETDAEAEAMEALETRILAHLGIADPYAEEAAGPTD